MNVLTHKCLGVKVLAVFTILVFSQASFGWAQVDAAQIEQILKENKELRDIVGQLTEKVDNLEGRVAKTEVAPQAAQVAGAAPAVEEGHGILLTKGGNIYMDGFVDTSFNWNFVTPNVAPGGTFATANSTIRSFDREADTFDLNAIQLNFWRPAPDDGGVGFRTEFTYGTDAGVIESAGFLGGTDELSIQEAFVDIKIPVGSGLTVWAGKFATLFGAEVIENFMNWNASRSLLFNNAIPFTHTGVRAMYNWLDGKVSTTVGLVNGWDNVIDNNKPKDVEAQLKWAPNENFSIGQNFMVGSQIADDRSDNRWLFDTVATWKALPKLTLMANYDYGTEERLGKISPSLEGGPADWQGYALYAKYDLTDKIAVAARWEQFWDDQSVRIGTSDQLWEMTYTLEYKAFENLITRLEYRHDHANSNNLGPKTFDIDSVAGGTENNQDTVGVSFIYLFG
ncbi:MAG: porin [Candidatus Omnitrophica bacterium]|nr:porin [Candidatus Omnitrophota bacterium]